MAYTIFNTIRHHLVTYFKIGLSILHTSTIWKIQVQLFSLRSRQGQKCVVAGHRKYLVVIGRLPLLAELQKSYSQGDHFTGLPRPIQWSGKWLSSHHPIHYSRRRQFPIIERPNTISPTRHGCGKEKSAFQDFKREHCGTISLINGHEGFFTWE